MLKLILLGPPGAGKGTQAAMIKQELGIPHISTGDIFRMNIKQGTELGKKAQEYINKGQLVPDDLVIEIVKDRLLEEDCSDSFLLDGFPRTVYQAEKLTQIMKDKGQQIDKVINLVVSKEDLMSRLSGRRVCKSCGATYNIKNMREACEGVCDACGGELYQRADDEEKTVANRIEVYEAETKPLVDYYQKIGNIVSINGEIGLEEVFAEILKALGA